MDPLHLFLLDQGFPVEYEVDEFNTPHCIANGSKLPAILSMLARACYPTTVKPDKAYNRSAFLLFYGFGSKEPCLKLHFTSQGPLCHHGLCVNARLQGAGVVAAGGGVIFFQLASELVCVCT